jgi:periplasmic divalent cation tolerance protein
MTDKIVVITTCDQDEEARRLARTLVEARLAACVQVVPQIRSTYWWQGKVEEAGEFLILIKSRRSLFDQLRAEIAKLHSYTVPEIIALPVVDGSRAYLEWIDRETE